MIQKDETNTWKQTNKQTNQTTTIIKKRVVQISKYINNSHQQSR
jgi:hypothetical protein